MCGCVHARMEWNPHSNSFQMATHCCWPAVGWIGYDCHPLTRSNLGVATTFPDPKNGKLNTRSSVDFTFHISAQGPFRLLRKKIRRPHKKIPVRSVIDAPRPMHS